MDPQETNIYRPMVALIFLGLLIGVMVNLWLREMDHDLGIVGTVMMGKLFTEILADLDRLDREGFGYR